MRLVFLSAIALVAVGCVGPPATVTRPEIRGTNGCTRVVPPDVRPRARFQTRMTLDMNEWCQKVASILPGVDHTI